MPEVDEREHLAELHRGALHPAEHRDDLLGRLDLAALERRLRTLLGAGDVGGAGPRLARCLVGGRVPDPRQTPDPPGGDPVGDQPTSSDVASRACSSSADPGSRRSSARGSGRR